MIKLEDVRMVRSLEEIKEPGVYSITCSGFWFVRYDGKEYLKLAGDEYKSLVDEIFNTFTANYIFTTISGT